MNEFLVIGLCLHTDRKHLWYPWVWYVTPITMVWKYKRGSQSHMLHKATTEKFLNFYFADFTYLWNRRNRLQGQQQNAFEIKKRICLIELFLACTLATCMSAYDLYICITYEVDWKWEIKHWKSRQLLIKRNTKTKIPHRQNYSLI